MSTENLREGGLSTSDQKIPIKGDSVQHNASNTVIKQVGEDEKNRLLKSDSEKKAQNRTSIDTNSKNEAAEALANMHNDMGKKVHPRIAQIGAESSINIQRKESMSSQGNESKELQIFSNEDQEEKEKKEELKAGHYVKMILHKILESTAFQIIINLLTVYSLFGSNVRIMATRQSADVGFDVVTIIALSMFTLEIILSVIVKKGYIFSFFFWLDILSTISLIMDINMVSNAIFYSGGGQVSGVAKAGQASRVGSKAGRVVRLVRLIRIVKLYKAAQGNGDNNSSQTSQNTFKLQEKLRKRKQNKRKVHPSDSRVDSKGPNESSGQINDEEQNSKSNMINSSSKEAPAKGGFNPPKESKVSKILTDITTKRVIILVLVLVFIMPLFSVDYYFDPPAPIEIAVKQMQLVSQSVSTQGDIQNQQQYIIDMFKGAGNPLVRFDTPFSFMTDYTDSDLSNLRDDELQGSVATIDLSLFSTNHASMTSEITLLTAIQNQGGLNIIGQASTRNDAIFSAALSFGSTIFICIVLTAGALLFSKDANDLALGPIERMRDKVIAIANDPLSSKDQKLIGDDENKEQYETVIIENAIVKIGTLLALGFGEAGSEIIAINMGRQGDVDPMIPGKKKCAIYGFCDIRNFTDATEVLQEDVMLFVNNIGDIVHTITDRYLGAANKNIGDAFLLVWRINPQKYTINEETNQIDFSDQQYISILADFAALAFLRIQSQLNRVPKILAYRSDKRLQDRIENYKVKMGFGLHIGWGIEGAIGSEFKIDASYLSPNVNMAARLEAATKQYGVPLLISSDLQAYFTPEMKKYTRYIDRVTVKGSIRPIGLYTVDMDVENIPVKKEIDPNFSKYDIHGINQVKKEEMRGYMENALSGVEPWSVDTYIKETKDLNLLFLTRNDDFQKNFAIGFSKYLEGHWQEGRQIFNDGLKMCHEDGPTKTILEVMGGTGFQAPSDWKGFRELTEK